MSASPGSPASWSSGEMLAPGAVSPWLTRTPSSLGSESPHAAPFATDGGSPFPPNASGRRRLQAGGEPQEPERKVGTVPFTADAYAAQRQATAAARQQRFDAALAAPPPFAVREAEGGMAGAATTSCIVAKRQVQRELSGKIGAVEGGSSFRRIPAKEPSFKITDTGKGWMWNQSEVEELGRQRRDSNADNRAKHWGMKPEESGLVL